MHNVGLQGRYQLLVGGQRKDTSDEKTFKTICPADGSVLAECAEATREDVDETIKVVWKAFGSWRHVTVNERAMILDKIADIIDADQEHLAMVKSLDNGKPIRETMAVDIPMSAQHFRYFAGCIMTNEGSVSMLEESTLSLILRELIDVAGQVVPWSFPFLMAAWRLAPVLACGCCTAFRSSSATPLSVLEFAKLIQDMLPVGVFNVIAGSGSKSGQYILEYKGFRELAFTGSTEVGRNAALAATQKLIPSAPELGGKSANIFFKDCNWEIAMDDLQMEILFSQGQVCCAGSRVLIQESIYDRFVEEAVKRSDQVRVDLPWETDTQIGSQISRAQIEKILKYMEVGESEGVSVFCGGQHLKTEGLENGCFLKPTLLGNVTNHMRMAQEEVFGPIACILRFRTEGEVVQMADDSEYGLGGTVQTRDINRTLWVSRATKTGRIWVDTYSATPEGASFEGYKTSGVGHETHRVMLEHYTQIKDIMVNLNETPIGFYLVK